MFPFNPGPHTHALHCITLSSDSLTTASWQRPHPDSLRQNIQDTGSGLEQGAPEAGLGLCVHAYSGLGLSLGQKFPFSKGPSPGPSLTKMVLLPARSPETSIPSGRKEEDLGSASGTPPPRWLELVSVT